MKITGQKQTNGEPITFTAPIEVVQFGDSLRDDTGMCWAIKDEYGDWVSPTLHKMGVKSVMVLTE